MACELPAWDQNISPQLRQGRLSAAALSAVLCPGTWRRVFYYPEPQFHIAEAEPWLRWSRTAQRLRDKPWELLTDCSAVSLQS